MKLSDMNKKLVLPDGREYYGYAFGYNAESVLELVFNTSMVGYQEIVSDPSYTGQAVVMTYPLIGNYGVNSEDEESRKPWVSALIVRRLSPRGSNFRSEGTLDDYLKRNRIPGICGVDTRAITRILRDYGTMNGMITTETSPDLDQKLSLIRSYRVKDTVELVTRSHVEVYQPEEKPNGLRVALLDYGVKENMIRSLCRRGCEVTVCPAHTPAQMILSGDFDGVMLSNGPGDPADNTQIISEVRRLYESDIPIFAVCLGHQLMALATGAATEKLKYGHRGGNHPVRDISEGRVYITSQNHGYVVRADSVNPAVAEISHVNVNDGSVEGLRYRNGRVFTVQFHPEASPGPRDTGYLFDRFVAQMAAKKEAEPDAEES